MNPSCLRTGYNSRGTTPLTAKLRSPFLVDNGCKAGAGYSKFTCNSRVIFIKGVAPVRSTPGSLQRLPLTTRPVHSLFAYWIIAYYNQLAWCCQEPRVKKI